MKLTLNPIYHYRRIRAKKLLSKEGKAQFKKLSTEGKERFYTLSREAIAQYNYLSKVIASNGIEAIIQAVNEINPKMGDMIAVYNRLTIKANIDIKGAQRKMQQILQGRTVSKTEVAELEVRGVAGFRKEVGKILKVEQERKSYKKQELKSDEELLRSKATFMQGITKTKSKEKGIGR